MLEWAGGTFVKLTKIQAWQELIFVLSAISKIESREKASKFEIIILMVWWHFMKNMLCCVYILTYAIDILCFIELLITWLSVFGYFLVCSVINAVKHQKVTKTLNNVINVGGICQDIKCTQQSIFFHELSLEHQNYNFEAFSRLSMLLIADKTNTNSCQAWILVNITNVAPAHSSIQYRQIFSYHLIEETYSYPHVYCMYDNFLKICWNIYMGGLFKSVNFFWYALYRLVEMTLQVRLVINVIIPIELCLI